MQNAQQTRRPDFPVQSTPAPPSPALYQRGSIKDKLPISLLVPTHHQGASGQFTPLTGVAQVNVSIAPNRLTAQQNGYTSREGSYTVNQTYGRVSPMVPAIQSVQPQFTANHPTRLRNEAISGQGESGPPKFSLWKILTCKCS